MPLPSIATMAPGVVSGLVAGYAVTIVGDWASARAGWSAAVAGGNATPFQHGAVMEAWFGAMASRSEIEPLIVTIRDVASGALVANLALVRTSFGGIRTIGFADLGLIGYNGPVLGPAAPRNRSGARRLWRALRQALPPAEIIDLRKMPPAIGGRPNPLALLGTIPCALNGNVVRTGDDWQDYHLHIRRIVRKELERSWRGFTRHPGAAFRSVTDPAERRRILAAMEEQQPLRMQTTGKTYVLDEPAAAAFYRNLAEAPAEDGTVVLTALMVGDEIVAALLGLKDAQDYIMIRISNAEGEWASASPGRLIIDQSMAFFHERGYRAFDFSIGDDDYKRRFGAKPTPLVDLVQPLGWRGLPAAVESRARALVRRPALRTLARRLLRR